MIRPLPLRLLVLLLFAALAGGCASIRVTDPPRSATEQFLMSQAVTKAVSQLTVTALRDRTVFVDVQFLPNAQDRKDPQDLIFQKNQEFAYLAGEVRGKLLASGVRLSGTREAAQIILELRSEGVGIDRTEFLFGLPSVVVSGAAGTDIPAATPELAIVKRTTQKGFGSVAFTAYWRETGELVTQSGPTRGKTIRQDYWFFGIGPSTVGNVIPTEPGD